MGVWGWNGGACWNGASHAHHDVPTRRTLDVGGVGGLELERALKSRVRFHARGFSRDSDGPCAWGFCVVGEVGWVLHTSAWPILGEFRRSSASSGPTSRIQPGLQRQASCCQDQGCYSGVLQSSVLEHLSGQSLVRHMHKRCMIINAARLSGDSGRAPVLIGEKRRSEGPEGGH